MSPRPPHRPLREEEQLQGSPGLWGGEEKPLCELPIAAQRPPKLGVSRAWRCALLEGLRGLTLLPWCLASSKRPAQASWSGDGHVQRGKGAACKDFPPLVSCLPEAHSQARLGTGGWGHKVRTPRQGAVGVTVFHGHPENRDPRPTSQAGTRHHLTLPHVGWDPQARNSHAVVSDRTTENPGVWQNQMQTRSARTV